MQGFLETDPFSLSAENRHTVFCSSVFWKFHKLITYINGPFELIAVNGLYREVVHYLLVFKQYSGLYYVYTDLLSYHTK